MIKKINISEIKTDLIEKVAEAIYYTEGGVTEEEFKIIFEQSRKLWKTDAPWDSNPNELHEHQRDEYRLQAKTAIDIIINELGLDS